ncbi:hypothetical protein BH23ACT2_BH23ACT2_02500 [soil metagenome]
MTDDHDPHRPVDPSPQVDASDDDRRWFRAAVHPVLDVDPVPDAWDEISARASGARPAEVPRAPNGRSEPNRLAIAAAVVVVLAGVFGVVALTADPAGDPDVITGAADPSAAPGWYVPTDLPDGWSIRSVELTLAMLECPCRTAVWVADEESSSLAFFSGPTEAEGQGPMDLDAMELVDLGGGVEAPLFDDGAGTVELSWQNDDRTAFLVGTGWEQDDLVRAARSFVASEGTATPGDGLEAVIDLTRPRGSYAVPQVSVSLEGPDASQLTYALSTAGSAGGFSGGTIPTEVAVDGQALPVFDLRTATDAGPDHPTYIGLWPGADVVVPAGSAPTTDDPARPRAQEVDRLVGSLRPATTDEWRRFLDDVGATDERLGEVDRLADLGTLPEHNQPDE